MIILVAEHFSVKLLGIGIGFVAGSGADSDKDCTRKRSCGDPVDIPLRIRMQEIFDKQVGSARELQIAGRIPLDNTEILEHGKLVK